MRAGRLRHRGTVEEHITSDDGQGGRTKSGWVEAPNLKRIPCRVEPRTGPERETAGQVQSRTAYTVTMRYRTGVNAGMRLVWHANGGDRTLNFVGAPAITGDYDGLEIEAVEDAD